MEFINFSHLHNLKNMKSKHFMELNMKLILKNPLLMAETSFNFEGNKAWLLCILLYSNNLGEFQ